MKEIRFLDDRVTLLIGDCLGALASLPADSVDCVVTSPPYWGLRDYGVEGQMGLEPTLAEHLAVMVEVFRAIRRVLKPEGTLWVNYGDCYATSPNGRSAADAKAIGGDDRCFRDKPFSTVQGALKPKDLCMVPNRLAIALQEDGWWVRAENIWAKPNPMPESAKDRPGQAHEKVFMLTKSARYFYDSDAVRIARKTFGEDGWPDWAVGDAPRSAREFIVHKEKKSRGHERPHQGFQRDWDQRTKAQQQADGRNLRNYEPAPPVVWKIATRPFSEAHFATFPIELAERCILAGSPKNGVILDPFGGAGTTALAALRHGRSCQLIELNPDYAALAQKRIETEWRAFVPPKLSPIGGLFEGLE